MLPPAAAASRLRAESNRSRGMSFRLSEAEEGVEEPGSAKESKAQGGGGGGKQALVAAGALGAISSSASCALLEMLADGGPSVPLIVAQAATALLGTSTVAYGSGLVTMGERDFARVQCLFLGLAAIAMMGITVHDEATSEAEPVPVDHATVSIALGVTLVSGGLAMFSAHLAIHGERLGSPLAAVTLTGATLAFFTLPIAQESGAPQQHIPVIAVSGMLLTFSMLACCWTDKAPATSDEAAGRTIGKPKRSARWHPATTANARARSASSRKSFETSFPEEQADISPASSEAPSIDHFESFDDIELDYDEYLSNNTGSSNLK